MSQAVNNVMNNAVKKIQQYTPKISIKSASLAKAPVIKKSLPAFVPREQNWSEDPLPINSNNIYQLLASPVAKPLDELIKDPSMPILAFTGTLLQEIRYITHKLHNSEYAVFLALRRIDENHPHFLAYDFFMPEQAASGGGVSLDPKDCQRHFDGLKTHHYYSENGLHRHLCHLHSHAGMQVFWSGTDNTQQLSRDDLGFMDDFRFYCVVNTEEEIKCSFVFYKPVLARVDAAVAVSFSGSDHALQLTRKRRQELDEMIEIAMSKSFSGTAQISEFAGKEKKDAVNLPNDKSRYSWADDYWDSFGDYASENAWSATKRSSTSTPGFVNGLRKEPDASDAQQLSLAWFAFLDNYKCVSKVPDTMLQAFMVSGNVDRKYSRRARKLLSWVMDQVFWTDEIASTENESGMATNFTENDYETIGDLTGEYVAELKQAMQACKTNTANAYDMQYISEKTVEQIQSGSYEKINEAIIEDIAEIINETL